MSVICRFVSPWPIRVKREHDLPNGAGDYGWVMPGDRLDDLDGAVIDGKLIKIHDHVNVTIGMADADCSKGRKRRYVNYDTPNDERIDRLYNRMVPLLKRVGYPTDLSGFYDYKSFTRTHPNWVDPQQ